MQLEQIAYVTAKELKEPLAIVSNDLQVVAENIANNLDEKGAKYLYYAKEGAERMDMLIDGMVKLANIDQHKMQSSPVNLNELVFEVFNKQNAEAGKAKIFVDVVNEQFINDTYLITKLLSIFFSNSFNYSKKNTELIIQINLTEANEDTWELSFSDNGIGIEEVYFERIFQMFQRLQKQNESPPPPPKILTAEQVKAKKEEYRKLIYVLAESMGVKKDRVSQWLIEIGDENLTLAAEGKISPKILLTGLLSPDFYEENLDLKKKQIDRYGRMLELIDTIRKETSERKEQFGLVYIPSELQYDAKKTELQKEVQALCEAFPVPETMV